MARKAARTAAMQMLYENMLGGDGGEETLRELIEFSPDEDDQQYIDRILSGVEEHAETLDSAIEQCLKGWTLDRVAKVDRAVLRLALYELYYDRDAPDAVIIDAAVALAQRFDSPASAKFVNGVLSTLLSRRPEGKQD